MGAEAKGVDRTVDVGRPRSRKEHDLDAEPFSPHAVQELEASHPGHLEVGHQDIEAAEAQEGEGLLPVRSLDHGKAGLPEPSGHDLAYDG